MARAEPRRRPRAWASVPAVRVRSWSYVSSLWLPRSLRGPDSAFAVIGRGCATRVVVGVGVCGGRRPDEVGGVKAGPDEVA